MAEHVPDTDEAIGLCTYCPSLCRHACPVATAEGSDTVSPWGMMSLAGHVRRGAVEVDAEVLATIGACNGCGACSVACLYQNPVMDALVATRAAVLKKLPRLAPKGRAPNDDAFEGSRSAAFDR